jgi:hypothetical protein
MKVNADGAPELDMTEIMKNPDALACLDIEFGVSVTKDGVAVQTYKVKTRDKLDAIEKLFKLKKLYSPTGGDENRTRPIQVNVNIPIPGSNWRARQQKPIEAEYTKGSDGE